MWRIIGSITRLRPQVLRAIDRVEIGPQWSPARPIPRTLVLTFRTLDEIPPRVLDRWSALNPGWRIRTFGDPECEAYLDDRFGPEQADRFRQIRDGPIKADYFRVHYLYADGGVYADVDMEPLAPLDEIVDVAEDTVLVPYSKSFLHLSPTFIVSRPGHCFMKGLMDAYDLLFEDDEEYEYWSWSIVHLASALNLKSGRRVPRKLREVRPTHFRLAMPPIGWDWYDCHITVPGPDSTPARRVLDVRSDEYDMLMHDFRKA